MLPQQEKQTPGPSFELPSYTEEGGLPPSYEKVEEEIDEQESLVKKYDLIPDFKKIDRETKTQQEDIIEDFNIIINRIGTEK